MYVIVCYVMLCYVVDVCMYLCYVCYVCYMCYVCYVSNVMVWYGMVWYVCMYICM